MFPRDIICLRNISINTVHRGDDDDDDDDNNNNNNTFSGQNNFLGYKLSLNLVISSRYEGRCQFVALDTPLCVNG